MSRITREDGTNFDFDREQKVMKMFTENAKSYIQLASGGLVLTVAFMREVMRLEPGQKIPPSPWMIATWIALLVAIVFGALYQYLAVKYLEQHLSSQSFEGLSWLADRCGIVYGVMLIAFYGAVLFFIILAVHQLHAQKATEGEQSLAANAQRLRDEEEIRNVLVSYGRTLDAHDFGAYSRLFAKDGEWVGGFGSVKGPALIEAFMAKNIGTPGKPSGTYHLLSNFLIDVHGDTATAWSRWAYVTPGPDKKPAMAQGGHYEDTLIRKNGQWKFSHREAFVDIPHADAPAAK